MLNSKTPDSIEFYAQKIQDIKAEMSKVIIGQEAMIDLMLYTLLSKGHILLEGVPGLAKSLAVETFAKAIGGEFQRFQFTPDKMPSDITGTTVFDSQEFTFHRGPIFCHIFLADEINRASPKVQSALLQAMQEHEVTVERETYPLPHPFIVLATQNPIEQIGTYPLAESQVDRFLVKYAVGYPSRDEETEFLHLKNRDFETQKAQVRPVLRIENILAIRNLIHERVRVTQTMMAYILDVCIATRPSATYRSGDLKESANPLQEIHGYIKLGASPRATESLLALAKSFAFCQGRDYMTFDDVNACAPHVLRHRILLNHQATIQQIDADRIVQDILKSIQPY